MKKSFDTERDVLDFKEMLADHMAENYPDVQVTDEMLEQRSRQAALEYENPGVSIATAMENAMNVLFKGYEYSKSEIADMLVCESYDTEIAWYMHVRIQNEILALCEPELKKIASNKNFVHTKEYQELKNHLLPILVQYRHSRIIQ